LPGRARRKLGDGAGTATGSAGARPLLPRRPPWRSDLAESPGSFGPRGFGGLVSFQDKMWGAEPTHGSGSGVWSGSQVKTWAKRDGSGRREGKRGKASGIRLSAVGT
jgi:hypothetical protein